MAYQFLSLDQLATIATAGPGLSAAALAKQLDCPYAVVVQAVRRIRRAGGWYSPVTWRPCTECDRPVASGPRGVRKVHASCERARTRRRSRERRRRHPEQNKAYLRQWATRHPERLAAFRKQAAQLAREQRAAWSAPRRGKSWTEEEERHLLEHPQASVQEVALQLGRSPDGVYHHRSLLLSRSAAAPTTGHVSRP